MLVLMSIKMALVSSSSNVRVVSGFALQVREFVGSKLPNPDTTRLQDLGVVFFTGKQSEPQKAEAKRAFMAGEARVMVIALRAGAGLDGLQHGCRTVVHGELDWSPAVHDQLDGRLHRDGQPDRVMASYLIADSGSDPIVSDVLGVKRAQLEGIRNPGGAGAAAPLIGSDKDIRRLAEDVLRQRGIALQDKAHGS